MSGDHDVSIPYADEDNVRDWSDLVRPDNIKTMELLIEKEREFAAVEDTEDEEDDNYGFGWVVIGGKDTKGIVDGRNM